MGNLHQELPRPRGSRIIGYSFGLVSGVTSKVGRSKASTSGCLSSRRGVYPIIVQKRLGHSQIVLILDTYSHLLPGMERDAASKLGALLMRTAEEALAPVAKL